MSDCPAIFDESVFDCIVVKVSGWHNSSILAYCAKKKPCLAAGLFCYRMAVTDLPVAARAAVLEVRLGCCQPRDRDAVRGAGDVVQADLVAEGDTGRLAAVLAADA